ncbi:MAG: PhnD/SsuA/transferrin family substrate-binding protein [Candidatus Thalassarchaeaceae archaeon]|jgi:melanoma-associated antigen p97|nr:PhnD/SsuA/transferrin family substrate-binding protein [Candidatus Thalassarchaeaceae archaeon]
MSNTSPSFRKTTVNIMLVVVLISSGLSGCLFNDDDDVIRIAFKIQDDYDNPDMNPQILADFISEQTGMDVELYPISSDVAAIEALRFGHADVAFLDGGSAWMAWQQHGFDSILADQKSDGSTYYVASAWVLESSEIETLEDLGGMDSCHTGWLKSAGMLMPMGYMIGQGFVEVSGDDESIESLRTTIENHFGDASIPSSGDPYYGYDGAFRCMTEGVGDVAFAKSTSFEDHCEGNDWCLERSEYRMLSPVFGQVPSHSVMVNREVTSEEKVEMIQSAFLALNSESDGQSILESVLNTPGISEVETSEHLGSYSDAISSIPGISTYFEDKYGN